MYLQASRRVRRVRPIGRYLALPVFGLIAAFGVGCHNLPLVAPSGSSITLVVNSTNVASNGSAQVTAVVIKGTTSTGTGTTTTTSGTGVPVDNGTVVTFATSVGHVDPINAPTTNGQAQVTLYADGQSGQATITAFSGGSTATKTVNVGAAGASTVVLTANPQQLAASGGTSVISAIITDANGSLIPGAPVSFSTTAGSVNPTTATTDSTGTAKTTLTSSLAATVTAAAGSKTGTVALTVAATPQITITLASGTGAIAGAPVSFTVTNATGAGTSPSLNVDFGDSSGTVPIGALAPGESAGASHFYSAGNIYTVTVKDSAGVTYSTQQAAISSLQVTFSAPSSATAVLAGAPITFSVSVPTGVSISGVTWDFGDSTPSPDGNSTSTSHAYAMGGKSYTVKVTVSATGGATATATTVVNIS